MGRTKKLLKFLKLARKGDVIVDRRAESRPTTPVSTYVPPTPGYQGGYGPPPPGYQGGYGPSTPGYQGGYGPPPPGYQSGYGPPPPGYQGYPGYGPPPAYGPPPPGYGPPQGYAPQSGQPGGPAVIDNKEKKPKKKCCSCGKLAGCCGALMMSCACVACLATKTGGSEHEGDDF